ncbi:MAG: DUF4249 domain-containing protein [Schleiferiaceae bacterium]|nr:DUF4249 domain-containing protein [Schleiferiaceae bacterium]
MTRYSRYYKIFVATFMVTMFSSCQDVVELDLPDTPALIVINGRITDSASDSVRVIVSATAPYFSQQPTIRVSNALVSLYENDQFVDNLDESSEPGVYVLDFRGAVGNTYHIEVTTMEDVEGIPPTTWRSVPEAMARVFEIDSIFVDTLPAQPPFRQAGAYPFFSFTEPAGRGDFYRLRRWVNDTLLNNPQDLQVFNDDFGDGRSFDNIDLPAIQFTNDLVEPGDKFKIEISSISERHFRFLNLVFQQTVQVGTTFDPPPAAIVGNIQNVATPSNTALGYFVVSAVSVAELQVPE